MITRIVLGLSVLIAAACLGACGVNFGYLNSRMPAERVELLMGEHVKIGMTQFRVDKALDDLNLERSYRPGSDDGTVIVIHVWPKGFFVATDGWRDRHTIGELRLHMQDRTLIRAEYWHKDPEWAGSAETTTELKLPEAES